MKRNKRGISLIVLVITIIVMIILAAAVIIALDNSGIISKANKAVGDANLDQVQHVASLIWADAYLDPDIANENITESYIREELGKQGINTDNYDIIVEDNGVEVKEKNNGSNLEKGNWKLEIVKDQENVKVISAKVTNGVDILDVGTTINYMPEGVGPTDAKYTGGWKILGVDDSGRLLIMSTSDVIDEVNLGGTNLEAASESYENALATLQTAVDDYKDGTIGVEVRSVKVEDIDALTGFVKTEYEIGKIDEYNNIVTYSWDGSDCPTYSYGTVLGKNLKMPHEIGFTYYDEQLGRTVTSPYIAGESGKIKELKIDAYGYHMSEHIDSSIPAYSLINVSDGNYYWFASCYTGGSSSYVCFGLRTMHVDYVCGNDFFYSYGAGSGVAENYGVRAVVTLAAGAELTESKTVAGTYDVILAK